MAQNDACGEDGALDAAPLEPERPPLGVRTVRSPDSADGADAAPAYLGFG